MLSKVWVEITYSSPIINGATEWISSFILHFVMDEMHYPYWDYSLSMLVKVTNMVHVWFQLLAIWFYSKGAFINNARPA